MSQRGRNFSSQEIEVVRIAWKNGINDRKIVEIIRSTFGIERTAKSVSMIRRKYRIVGKATKHAITKDAVSQYRKEDDAFRGAMLNALESGAETMPVPPPVSTRPHYIPTVSVRAQVYSRSPAAWCAELGSNEL